MKFHKKGQESGGSEGMSTIAMIFLILAIAIILIAITIHFTSFGKTAWAKITNAFAFV